MILSLSLETSWYDFFSSLIHILCFTPRRLVYCYCHNDGRGLCRCCSMFMMSEYYNSNVWSSSFDEIYANFTTITTTTVSNSRLLYLFHIVIIVKWFVSELNLGHTLFLAHARCLSIFTATHFIINKSLCSFFVYVCEQRK